MEGGKGEQAKSTNIRFIILVLGVLLSTSIYCDQQALSFTVICMQDVVQEQSQNSSEVHWLDDPAKKNALFSVVAVGQLAGTIPVVPLMQAVGLRYTYAFYGIVAGCGTLMIPLSVAVGHLFVMIARFLQGFAMAIAFVSVGAITSQWSVIRESGTYIAFLSCSPQLSSVITLPLASAYCESSLGWRSLYYTLGGVVLVAVAAFLFLYRDDPRKHWMVSEKELSAIAKGKDSQSSVREPVPYKEICMDRCILSVLLTTFGGNMAFFIFLHYGPTIINKAFGFNVAETGFATALPYALCLLLKFVAGPLFDLSTFISERNRMIMFASLSQGVMMLCFFALSQASSKVTAQIAFSGAVAFNGLNIVGSIKCAQVVARQHVHFVLVCITIIGCLVSFILPAVVAVFCPTNSMTEWSRLFLGAGFFVLLCNIPFLIFARSEPAPWTQSLAQRKSTSVEKGEQLVVAQDHRIHPESPKTLESGDAPLFWRSESAEHGSASINSPLFKNGQTGEQKS
ncbi:hypothetical protein Q1695_014130 [Nippostrongylus brasiliensis]|nr:hypothetical protein Q1695_014130 [Nippostrongylus brasiliensis]